MALSCVYRTGQRFGVGHLVDVLLGKETERITKFGHKQLSTFGIGVEHTAQQWSSIYRQLIAGGYLEADIEAYGGLMLTATARPVLKGEVSLSMRRDTEPAKRKSVKTSRDSKAREPFSGANEDRLWLALKAKRMELAREQGVPPYVIFHDSTLLEMMDHRPGSLTELSRISGVGQGKLARYGDDFLKVFEENL